jgi:hypothetical protein
MGLLFAAFYRSGANGRGCVPAQINPVHADRESEGDSAYSQLLTRTQFYEACLVQLRRDIPKHFESLACE